SLYDSHVLNKRPLFLLTQLVGTVPIAEVGISVHDLALPHDLELVLPFAIIKPTF
ncbi:MAG: hypothetical protein ACI974_000375, partial [Paraglaciecola sp.]